MGERKIINKYIPSDFDPSLVPRKSQTAQGLRKKALGTADLVEVRMMLPFTLQCNTCKTFQYRGKKYNSKKQAAMKLTTTGAVTKDPLTYLGVQIWRFYIKCNVCSRSLTFLTDPEKGDYKMESGGDRTFESWGEKTKEEEDAVKQEGLDVVNGGVMGELEKRVKESRREMVELDELEEIKNANERNLRGVEDILNRIQTEKTEEEEEEEDRVQAGKIQFGVGRQVVGSEGGEDGDYVSRLESEDDDDDGDGGYKKSYKNDEQSRSTAAEVKNNEKKRPSAPLILTKIVKKPKTVSKPAPVVQDRKGITSLLGDYGSSSDDDE